MALLTMSQRILERVQLWSRYAQDLVNTPGDGPGPKSFLHLREGFHTCLLLRDYLRRSCKLLLEDVYQNRTEDYQGPGTLFLAAAEVVLLAYEGVLRSLRESLPGAWPEVERAELERCLAELEAVVTQVREMRHDFAARWPWLNEERLRRSLSEEAAARRRPARVALDEIRHRH